MKQPVYARFLFLFFSRQQLHTNQHMMPTHKMKPPIILLLLLDGTSDVTSDFRLKKEFYDMVYISFQEDMSGHFIIIIILCNVAIRDGYLHDYLCHRELTLL